MKGFRPYLLMLPLLACTGDASGPSGALERALAHARPDPGPGAEESPRALANGAVRSEASLTLTYGAEGDGPRQQLMIHRVIERRGDAFRILDERIHRAPSDADPSVEVSHRDAVEWVFDSEALAWRHGGGPWIERDVLDGLAERALVEASGLADFTLAAFRDYARETPRPEPDDAHPALIAGLPVRWSTLDLDAAVVPVALDEATLLGLRDHIGTVGRWLTATHRPTRLNGEAAAGEDGAIVQARLSVAGEVRLSGRHTPFSLELEQVTSPLDAAASFELPADRLPESRRRTWHMIEQVLGDELLPPYRLRPTDSPR